LAELRETYEYQRANKSTDEDFETWCGTLADYAFETDLADAAKISQLEAATKATFPDALKAFWASCGKLKVTAAAQDLTINIYSVSELLSYLSPDAPKYQALADCGLMSMSNFAWGNSKPYLSLESDVPADVAADRPFPLTQMVALNTKYTTFGSMIDATCECHLHLHVDRSGNFGATYWHQDRDFLEHPQITGFGSPEALIMACLKTYEAIRAEEPDDPYFNLDMLTRQVAA